MSGYLSRVCGYLSIAVCCTGCGTSVPDAKTSGDSQSSAMEVDDRVAEPWVSKPKPDWPQIVLTNDAEFDGHTLLLGASSFLIRTDDDRTMAATARHLIGSAGGVEPEIPVNQLESKIRSWKMFPRTMPDDFVEIAALGAQGLTTRSSIGSFSQSKSALHCLLTRSDCAKSRFGLARRFS